MSPLFPLLALARAAVAAPACPGAMVSSAQVCLADGLALARAGQPALAAGRLLSAVAFVDGVFSPRYRAASLLFVAARSGSSPRSACFDARLAVLRAARELEALS